MPINVQIKYDLQNKRYSELDFLFDSSRWEENPEYLGLAYFVLQSQGNSTQEMFDQIVEKQGNQALAYRYLGEIAESLFGNTYNGDIALFYYQESLKLETQDTITQFKIYLLSGDWDAFINAIKIEYQKNNINQLNNLLCHCNIYRLNREKINNDDFLFLKNICLSCDLKNSKNLLAYCYFYLNEIESGINLFKSEGKFNKEIVSLYFDGGLIDLDFAIDKMFDFNVVQFLEDKPKLLYEKIKLIDSKGDFGFNFETLIKFAFNAEQYNDVINRVNSANDNEVTINIKLYYVISSLKLNLEINNNYEDDINKHQFSKYLLSEKAPDLLMCYFSYLILKNLYQLEKNITNNNLPCMIENMGIFIDAKNYLNHDFLLSFWFREQLINDLNKVRERWNSLFYTKKIEKINDKEINLEDKTELSIILMNLNKFNEALNILNTLDNNSMKFCHLKGLCCQSLGDEVGAHTHFKKALEIMNDSGERNYEVIGSYLKSSDLLGKELDSSFRKQCIEQYNLSIIDKYSCAVLTQRYNSLYKYYPFNNFTLDSLINGYFYLPLAEQLNDPIEMPFDKLVENKEYVYIQPNFRIASFSKNKNSMLMWSHYAANHSGIMVEYAFFRELPDGVGIADIEYTNVLKRKEDKNKFLFNQYLLTKNSDWEYEKEIRIFSYGKDKIYYKKFNYPNIVHDKADACIRSITLGYKFPDSLEKLIINIVNGLNSNDTTQPKIVIRKAKLCESNFFELEYEEINY